MTIDKEKTSEIEAEELTEHVRFDVENRCYKDLDLEMTPAEKEQYYKEKYGRR